MEFFFNEKKDATQHCSLVTENTKGIKQLIYTVTLICTVKWWLLNYAQYLSSCRISRNIYGFRDSRSTHCLNSLFKPICFCWDWISVLRTYNFLKKLPPDLKTCVWKFFFWIIKGEFLLAIFWETEKQLHNLHSLKDEKKIFWTSDSFRKTWEK